MLFILSSRWEDELNRQLCLMHKCRSLLKFPCCLYIPIIEAISDKALVNYWAVVNMFGCNTFTNSLSYAHKTLVGLCWFFNLYRCSIFIYLYIYMNKNAFVVGLLVEAWQLSTLLGNEVNQTYKMKFTSSWIDNSVNLGEKSSPFPLVYLR